MHITRSNTIVDSLFKMAESNSTVELIDKIIGLKIANRDTIFNLNKQIDDLKDVVKQKDNQILNLQKSNKLENDFSERDRTIEDLRSENTSLKMQMSKITADLEEMQKEFSGQKEKGLCIIEELKRENRNLKARVKQFRMSINETAVEDNSTAFAVEKILDDKILGKKRQYLVRWEGFDSNDDSWEPADNLDCPKKIAEYEKSKKKASKKCKK